MACTNCNCSDNKCGCKDAPLTTAPVYTCPPDITCPDPTPCYETIQDTCVKHGTYSILDFAGSGYTLPAGSSLENAFQALSLTLFDELCTPVVNLHPSYIGTTTIIVSWENTGAETYDVEISTNGLSWTSTTGLTTTSYTYTNLTPSTNYYFRVRTNCNGGDNDSISAVIIVTTLGLL